MSNTLCNNSNKTDKKKIQKLKPLKEGMTTETKSPIAGHMVLKPISVITENLENNRKKYTRDNPSFRTK